MKKAILNDEELVGTIREQLDASVDRLDPKVADRLYRARMQALAAAPEGKGWYGFFPAWLSPARLSLGAVGLLAVSLFAFNPSHGTRGMAPEDLEVVTSQENMTMIQDLDFYRWLATNPQLVKQKMKAEKR
ncbi:DUF3619 family protein [Geomesophilobacter sediminis]|uniref:DUF3619 family protein n=1 Tax=Geomesophilobacter sediminis TaxID=2798584 RepID=A0A8J7LTZ3_9BACT|nr:DUF3619 family protein [Geomesophilobacter sediminis]MBJ6723130.1 DUF3619 family protein [Geomesophilobacter sediminis]